MKSMKNFYKMVFLSFKEFVERYEINNEATSNIKMKDIRDILKLNSTGIYMRDDKFTTTAGKVNLHPTKETHWVLFSNQNYFDSDGCPPPTNIKRFLLHNRKKGIYSEYQI